MHPRRRVFVGRYRGTLSLHWVLGGVEFTILKLSKWVAFVLCVFHFSLFFKFLHFFWFKNRISRKFLFILTKELRKFWEFFIFLVSSRLVLLIFWKLLSKFWDHEIRCPHIQRIFVEKKGLNCQDLDFFPIAIYISTIGCNK